MALAEQMTFDGMGIDATSPRTLNDGIKYAEEILDVHGVFETAKAEHRLYAEAVEAAAQARQRVKMCKDDAYDRELAIASEQASEKPKMSVGGWRDHIKELLGNDPAYQEITRDLRDAEAERDACDAEALAYKQNVNIHLARMEVIASLLRFYTASISMTLNSPK